MNRFACFLLTLFLALSSSACTGPEDTKENAGRSRDSAQSAQPAQPAPAGETAPSPAEQSPEHPAQPKTAKTRANTETKLLPPAGKPSETKKTSASKSKVPATPVQPAYTLKVYERELIRLVNEEREKRGLKPLRIDLKASQLARKKADDMRKKHYFSHQSPTYGSPFDMLRKFGVSFTMAGENIAAGQRSPRQVMDSWMNSEGHRANILNSGYTLIGVGYVTGGDYGTYWTQLFLDR